MIKLKKKLENKTNKIRIKLRNKNKANEKNNIQKNKIKKEIASLGQNGFQKSTILM